MLDAATARWYEEAMSPDRLLANLYAAAADVNDASVGAETWWDVFRATDDEGLRDELVCTVSDRADASTLSEGRGAYGSRGRIAAVQVLRVAVHTHGTEVVAFFRLAELRPLDESRAQLQAAALRKLTLAERRVLMENA